MSNQWTVISDQKNMRIMKMHEALGANLGMNLFCSGPGFTKQILGGVFGRFCLILLHKPHIFNICLTSFRIVNKMITENMRLMREHEDRVFKGIRLSCIEIGMGACQKYEDRFEKYEAYLHVLTPDPLPLCGFLPNPANGTSVGKRNGVKQHIQPYLL